MVPLIVRLFLLDLFFSLIDLRVTGDERLCVLFSKSSFFLAIRLVPFELFSSALLVYREKKIYAAIRYSRILVFFADLHFTLVCLS